MIVRLAVMALLMVLANPQVGMAADEPPAWTRATLLAISDQELQKSGVVDPNRLSVQMRYVEPTDQDYASLASTLKTSFAEATKAAEKDAKALGKPFVRPPPIEEFTGHGIWEILYSWIHWIHQPDTWSDTTITVYIDNVTGHVIATVAKVGDSIGPQP